MRDRVLHQVGKWGPRRHCKECIELIAWEKLVCCKDVESRKSLQLPLH